MSFVDIGTNVVRLSYHCKNCIGLVDGKHSQSGWMVGEELIRVAQKENRYGDALSVGRKNMTTETSCSAGT